MKWQRLSFLISLVCSIYLYCPTQSPAESDKQYWYQQLSKIGVDEIVINLALQELKTNEQKGRFLVLTLMDIPPTTALSMAKNLSLKKQDKVLELYQRERMTPSVALQAITELSPEELSGMMSLYRGGFWDMSAITAIKFLNTAKQRAMAILLKQAGFDDLFAVNGGMTLEPNEVDAAIYMKKNGLSSPLCLFFCSFLNKEQQEMAIDLLRQGKSSDEILRIVLEKVNY